MFEYHGWIRLFDDDIEDEDLNVLREREARAIEGLEAELARVGLPECSFCQVVATSNGMKVLVFHGLNNHRNGGIFEPCRWLASHYPGSYGLVYVHDDEHDAQYNEFRVWRLAQGKFEEFQDPFLSPCVPTIERPFSAV